MLPVRPLQGYVPPVLAQALLSSALFAAPAAEGSGRAVVEPEAGAGEEAVEETDERGNTVLSGRAKVPSFDVSALLRFGLMLGETRQLTQPVGYGFGMVMRVHPWRAGAAHLGFAFTGGHLRAPQLERLPPADDPNGPLTARWQRVALSDFSGGLSLRAPLGPVVFSSELAGGVVIGEFVRPTSSSAIDDEVYESVDPSLRAGMWLGAPFRNNHGLVVGVALTKVFSGIEVADAQGQGLSPFDFVTELSFGYQGWF
jgi:hypothetical protein